MKYLTRDYSRLSLKTVGALCVGAIAMVCYFAAPAAAGETQFYTKLKNGENPTFYVIGNSTSQSAATTEWSSYKKNYCEWPKRLKEELETVGEVNFEGHTAPGKHSKNFIDGTEGFAHNLDWVNSQAPDAVIMEFAPGADAVERFNITLSMSRQYHEQIITSMLATNPSIEIFLWTGARSYGGKWAQRLGDGDAEIPNAREDGIAQPEYAAMLLEVASASGPNVYVVDTYTDMVAIYEQQGESTYKTYMYDDNHTNDKAATDIIVPKIIEVMRQGNGPAPALSLINPTPSAKFSVGDVMTISWSYNPDSLDAPLDITYSPDNGKSELVIVGGANTADGKYEWTIPAQLGGIDVVSQEGVIEISDYDKYEYKRTVNVIITPAGTEPIIVDNSDAGKVQFVGTWAASSASAGFYGADYQHDNNASKGSMHTVYTPGIAAVGNYEIFMQWTSHANRASNVPVSIKTLAGNQTVIVNQREDGGKWNNLGTFPLGTDATVTLSNAGTDGIVVADAVKFEYLGATSTATATRSMASMKMHRAPRVVTSVNAVRIPAGVAGLRLYSVSGRLVYKADRLGDSNTERLLAVPNAQKGAATYVVDYIDE